MRKKEIGKRVLSLALVLAMVFGMFGTQVTAVGLAGGASSTPNPAITVDGTGNAVILLPEDASDHEQLAAKELQDHVALVSGAWLPMDTMEAGGERAPLRYLYKENTISVGQNGYYPFEVMLHNNTDKVMNLTLQQAKQQEDEPQLLIRGESDTGDTFRGKVSLNAGERAIVSGLVAVTGANDTRRFSTVIHAKDGDDLVADIPLRVIVDGSVKYIGNTTFQTAQNWTLDGGSSLDTSVGYRDTTSLKITGTASPTHSYGVGMTAGNLYRLRFWAKSDASGGTVQAVVTDHNLTGAEKNKSLYMTKEISGDWKEYTYYFVGNSGQISDYGCSEVKLNCKGNLWIDDLSLVDCGKPTNKLVHVAGRDYTAFEYDPANKGSYNYWGGGTITTAEKHSGNQSYQISAAANKSNSMQWGIGMLKAESEMNVPYTISFWAKAQQKGTALELTMSRSNQPILHTFILSDEWEQYEFVWQPQELVPNGMGYMFRLAMPTAGTARTVWIDDTLFLPTTVPAAVETPDEAFPNTNSVHTTAKATRVLGLNIEIATADAANTRLRTQFSEEITYLETLTGPNGRKFSSDGFAIQKRENTVYIFGTEDRGTLNGVYDFIEYNADVLWHRAGQAAYQENKNIQLKKYNCCEKSPFSVRGWNAVGVGNTGSNNYDPDFDLQQSRNKMNVMYVPCYPGSRAVANLSAALADIGIGIYTEGHNIGQWILHSPSYDPENMVYWNQNADGVYMNGQSFGTDTYAQINMWDPQGEVSDCMVDSLIAYLALQKENGLILDQIGIGLNDTRKMPQLGYDDKPFEYAPGQFVQPGDANYLPTVSITFFNTVAQKLRDRGYDIKVNLFAYLLMEEPPACQVDRNLSILYAPSEENIRFPLNQNVGDYPGFDTSKNIMYHRQLETWGEKTSDVVVYTYYGCFAASKEFERMIGKKMQADMQYLAEKGFRGMLPEGQVDNGPGDEIWEQNTLTFWLYSKLLWNPDADVHQLVAEFCTKVYGVAAQDMIRYYQLRELAWDGNSETGFSHGTDIYRLLTFGLMRSRYITAMVNCVNDAWQKLGAAGASGERGRAVLGPIREVFLNQASTYSRYPEDYGWPKNLPNATVILNTANKVTLSITKANPVVYATTDASGVATLVSGEAPVDNYVMLTYDDIGIPTLYMKNATLKGSGQYGVIELDSAAKKVFVIENSSVTATDSATAGNNVGIGSHATSGDAITVDGPGKLTITAKAVGIEAKSSLFGGANIIIEKAADIAFVRTGGNAMSATKGKVTVKGNVTVTTGGGPVIVAKEYVQESGDVTVHFPSYHATNKGIDATNIQINGGNLRITAESPSGTYAINGAAVTLNGGSVYTNTGRAIVASGAVVINGGSHYFENNFSSASVDIYTVQGASVAITGGEVTITAAEHAKAYLANTAITLPASGYLSRLGTSRDGSGATAVSGTAAANNSTYCYFSTSQPVNEFTTVPAIGNWSCGETAKIPVGEAKYGQVTFYFAPLFGGSFTTTVPTAGGTYRMKAVVAAGSVEGQPYGEISQVVIFTINHTIQTEWSHGTQTHWHACAGCSVRFDEVSHSGTDDGDCTTALVCTCGYVITPAMTHAYTNNHDTSCNNAGCENTREQIHNVSAGWTYNGSTHWHACSGCSERFDEVSHSGTDDGDCTTALVCACGYVMTPAKSHTYDNNHDTACNNAGCRKTREQIHNVDAGWSFDGSTHWHACTGCDRRFDEVAHPGSEPVCGICGYGMDVMYFVAFENWDGSIISSQVCFYGETVTAPANPVRPDDSRYTYTFAGWDQEIVNCKGDATYRATYTAKSRVPDKITSNQHAVENGVCRKISLGTTVSALIANLNEKQFVEVYLGSTKVSGSAIVCTGMVIKLMDGSTVKDQVTVVVTGDVNGDGKLTITDMIAAKAHLLKKTTLQGVYAQACDLNGDGKITITDFIQFKAHVLGKSSVQAN